jgi:plastocyanin
MHRSLVSIILVALALLVAGCAAKTASPTAAVSTSSPRPAVSVPRGEAMEGGSGSEEGEEEDNDETEAPGAEVYYFDVDAENMRYDPVGFSLSLSEQIELHNNDDMLHNVTIPAAGLSLDVEPGAEDYTRPITLRPGRYEFFCRIHRAAGMRGYFTMTSSRDIITLRRGY